MADSDLLSTKRWLTLLGLSVAMIMAGVLTLSDGSSGASSSSTSSLASAAALETPEASLSTTAVGGTSLHSSHDTVASERTAQNFDSAFLAADERAQSYLTRIGRAVQGKVYVYRDWPLNWLGYLEEHGCVDLSVYCHEKHGGDCQMARQMQSLDAPWTTENQEEATLFVVPALLGFSIAKTPWGKGFGVLRSNGPCSFTKMRQKMLIALRETKFWKARPHLFMSGGWQSIHTMKMLYAEGDRVLVGHFETSPGHASYYAYSDDPSRQVVNKRFSPNSMPNVAILHDPYVGVCGGTAQRLRDAWSHPTADRRIALHFRGQITRKLAYSDRRGFCDDVMENSAQFGEVPGRIICASSDNGRSNVYPKPCREGCSAPNSSAPACLRVLQCNTPNEMVDYCGEVRESKMVLMIHGDTPSSRRLHDAVDFGALPLIRSPGLTQVLGGKESLVRWSDFFLDEETTASVVRTLRAGIHERERSNMLKWSPMISWNLSPRTTAMYILAQAAAAMCGWRGWAEGEDCIGNEGGERARENSIDVLELESVAI